MPDSQWEFKRGDIVANIGGIRKCLVIGVANQFGSIPCYVLCRYASGVDYLTKEPQWLDKSICEGNFVLVGKYDFHKAEEMGISDE